MTSFFIALSAYLLIVVVHALTRAFASPVIVNEVIEVREVEISPHRIVTLEETFVMGDEFMATPSLHWIPTSLIEDYFLQTCTDKMLKQINRDFVKIDKIISPFGMPLYDKYRIRIRIVLPDKPFTHIWREDNMTF